MDADYDYYLGADYYDYYSGEEEEGRRLRLATIGDETVDILTPAGALAFYESLACNGPGSSRRQLTCGPITVPRGLAAARVCLCRASRGGGCGAKLGGGGRVALTKFNVEVRTVINDTDTEDALGARVAGTCAAELAAWRARGGGGGGGGSGLAPNASDAAAPVVGNTSGNASTAAPTVAAGPGPPPACLNFSRYATCAARYALANGVLATLPPSPSGARGSKRKARCGAGGSDDDARRRRRRRRRRLVDMDDGAEDIFGDVAEGDETDLGAEPAFPDPARVARARATPLDCSAECGDGGDKWCSAITGEECEWRDADDNPMTREMVCRALLMPVRSDPDATVPADGDSCTPCRSKQGCLGGSLCDVGYEGENCANCQQGYYALLEECIVCPDNAWVTLMAMFIAFVLVCALIYMMGANTEGAASAGVLVTHFQLVSAFVQFGITWPCEFQEWTQWLLDVFSFKLDFLAHPECSMTLSPMTGWLFKLTMPCYFVMCFIAYFLFSKYLRPKLTCWRSTFVEHHEVAMTAIKSNCMRACAQVLSVLYIFARHDSADDFCRLKAPRCTAMTCFSFPRIAVHFHDRSSKRPPARATARCRTTRGSPCRGSTGTRASSAQRTTRPGLAWLRWVLSFLCCTAWPGPGGSGTSSRRRACKGRASTRTPRSRLCTAGCCASTPAIATTGRLW